MVENEIGTEAPGVQIGLEEAVDHGKPVFEPVGQGGGDQPVVAVRRAGAVLDERGIDGGVLDHGNEVERRHVCHAALLVAHVEIGAQ